MSNSYEHVVRICGLPKTFSRYKLRVLLERFLGKEAWHIKNLIPLESWSLADIFCYTADLHQRLHNFHSLLLPQLEDSDEICFCKMPTIANNWPQHEETRSSEISLLDLNYDCLHHLLSKCDLQTQITLAKVCLRLYFLIEDIWRQRFQTLNFSIYKFHTLYNLTDVELGDFALVVGPYVRHLIFDTVLQMSIIKDFLVNIPGNIMHNAKRYYNLHLCKYLQHFEQLQIFQVQGKFIADFTILELSRYCKQLRHFELLDPGNSWMVGKYLNRLPHLEVLQIKDCATLLPRFMQRICRTLPLKALNIVDCQLFLDARIVQRICHYLTNVETLQLSALADVHMLKCILNLPRLKSLKFFWHNDFDEFEILLYSELIQHCRKPLTAIRFANEPIFQENMSQRFWFHDEYQKMRELVTINGSVWQWHDRFDDVLNIFQQLTSLEELTWEYCRLCTQKQLQKLTCTCRNLRKIKIIGCRSEDDDKLLNLWQHEMGKGNCKLFIEGVPWQVVDQLRRKVGRFHMPQNRYPLLRSIACKFGSLNDI